VGQGLVSLRLGVDLEAGLRGEKEDHVSRSEIVAHLRDPRHYQVPTITTAMTIANRKERIELNDGGSKLKPTFPSLIPHSILDPQDIVVGEETEDVVGRSLADHRVQDY
jgi:hypothetical protein